MPSDKDIVVEARRLLALDTPAPWLRISPELLRALADEVERLRRALVSAAIPYEALLLDSESRKWIAPNIWKEIESATMTARAAIQPAKD